MLLRRLLTSRFLVNRQLSFSSKSESNSTSDRIRLVEGWKPTKLDFRVNIEIAREEDAPLTLNFMRTDSRTSEPTCVAMNVEENDMPSVFHEINKRSIGSGLTLLMFREEDEELIGIRMTSVSEDKEKRIKKVFKLENDYKDIIDAQPSKSRKEQRIMALCNTMYEFGPMFLPEDCHKWFCMELIGIKKQYRMANLSAPFVQEMFKLAASKGYQYGEVLCTARASTRVCEKLGMKTVLEMPFDKFLDNGEACFANTPDGSTGAQLMVGNLEEMGYKIKRQ